MDRKITYPIDIDGIKATSNAFPFARSESEALLVKSSIKHRERHNDGFSKPNKWRFLALLWRCNTCKVIGGAIMKTF